MIMHVEYRDRLPDHDWVVAEKNKFIPSVKLPLKFNEMILET